MMKLLNAISDMFFYLDDDDVEIHRLFNIETEPEVNKAGCWSVDSGNGFLDEGMRFVTHEAIATTKLNNIDLQATLENFLCYPTEFEVSIIDSNKISVLEIKKLKME